MRANAKADADIGGEAEGRGLEEGQGEEGGRGGVGEGAVPIVSTVPTGGSVC